MTGCWDFCCIAVWAFLTRLYVVLVAMGTQCSKNPSTFWAHLSVASFLPNTILYKYFSSPARSVWNVFANPVEAGFTWSMLQESLVGGFGFVQSAFDWNDPEGVAQTVGFAILPLLWYFGVFGWVKQKFDSTHPIWENVLTYLLFAQFVHSNELVRTWADVALLRFVVVAALARIAVNRFKTPSRFRQWHLFPLYVVVSTLLNLAIIQKVGRLGCDRVSNNVLCGICPHVLSLACVKFLPKLPAANVTALNRNNVGWLIFVHVFLDTIYTQMGSPDGLRGPKNVTLSILEQVFALLPVLGFVIVRTSLGLFRGPSVVDSGDAACIEDDFSGGRLIENGKETTPRKSSWSIEFFFCVYVLWLIVARVVVVCVLTVSPAVRNNDLIGSSADIIMSMIMWWILDNSFAGSRQVSIRFALASLSSPVVSIFSMYASWLLFKEHLRKGDLSALGRFMGVWYKRRFGDAVSRENIPHVSTGDLHMQAIALQAHLEIMQPALDGRGTQKRIEVAAHPQSLAVPKAAEKPVPKAPPMPVTEALPMPVPEAAAKPVPEAPRVSRKRARGETTDTDEERPSKQAKY